MTIETGIEYGVTTVANPVAAAALTDVDVESTDELSALEQKAKALMIQITTRKAEQRAGVIEEIKARMAEYDIAPDDLKVKRLAKAKPARAVTGGFKDLATGLLYKGKGKPPTWLSERLAATGLTAKEYCEQHMSRITG